ncbi:ABC transporter substrate-binding protein [Bacillus carboniphilus]|uniref:ABC transporter substrate-binding protein n=1 Tax=Bacillus carboniphilus TaxID=86663 RepID=A0ABN0WQZ5_9BACI
MLKMGKWVGFLMLATMLILAGCGSQSSNGDGTDTKTDRKTFTIGVTQIAEHPSLDAAVEGFKKALEDKGIDATYDLQIAQGDPSLSTTIAQNFVSSGVDLIFANATPSAQTALAATKDIPIVFTSVTDPVGSELVPSLEEPGGNITGTMDLHPEAIPNTLKFIKDELGASNVGLVYNSGETNSVSQVNSIKELLSELGLEAVEATVSNSSEVKQAAESLVGKIDAFYIITDNTVVSALESVVSVANERDIPMLAGEFDSVERGAFGAYGFDYYDIGYEAGLMAVDILNNGKSPADIPVQVPQNLKLVLNKKAAEEQGVELKSEWDDIAEYLE